jgi:hypothetical protein
VPARETRKTSRHRSRVSSSSANSGGASADGPPKLAGAHSGCEWRTLQSYRGRSLWEATFSYVQERETLLQAEVLTRFRNDDEASVRAVLNDLVESGLVFRSGRAEGTTLRAARPEEVSLAGEQNDDGVASLVWLAATTAEIQGMVPVDSVRLRGYTSTWAADGRTRSMCSRPKSASAARALCAVQRRSKLSAVLGPPSA